MNAPTPVKKSTAQKAFSQSVRLLPSALFFSANNPVPAGIRARDMSSMVEGLVDEHSPLPLEQTAWGFVLDSRRKQRSHFLYYAAPRDLVFPQNTEATNPSLGAVLPGLVATVGLLFKQPTWLFLLESECLSAIRFDANTTVPNRIFTRFLTSDELPLETAFKLRAEWVNALIEEDDETSIDGLIRVEQATVREKKGLSFKLQQCVGQQADWSAWQRTELRKPTRVNAADLREQTALNLHQRHKTAGKRITQVAALFILAILTLGVFEYLQLKQESEATRLTSVAEQQKPEVERLKEIESMTKALKQLFQREFEPFHWLMAANAERPDALSISSFALDQSGEIIANGEVTEVKALNAFVEKLQSNPKFEAVSITSLNTSNEGTIFSLKLKTGNLDAIVDLPLDTEVETTPPSPEEPASETDTSPVSETPAAT